MDCNDFLHQHASYVDQLCSALEEAEMRAHVRQCPSCSRHDTLVRRSLMLVKSLPTIQPSPDFRARLEARLRSVSLATPAPRTLPTSVTFVALAAGVAFVAFLATLAVRQSVPREIRMAPVVASIPEARRSPLATSALVATVPTGMSVWPAIMLASEAPMLHFVATEMGAER